MSEDTNDQLQLLRGQSRKGLQFLISYLLTNAEASLLGAASKARGSLEQSQSQEAVHELRTKGAALERGFLARALGGFDELGQSTPPPALTPRSSARTAAPAAQLSVAGLGVVKENLLEEQLALENIASRARHDHRDALVRLAQLIARLLGSRRVSPESLPIGPQALAQAFVDTCSEIEVAAPARVVFFRLFHRFVIDELGPFYAQCLALFPEEESAPVAAAPVTRSAAPAAKELPTGHQAEDAEAGAGKSPVSSPEAIWDNERTPLLAPPGKAMAMPRNLVDEVLDSLQERMLDARKPLAALNPRAGIQPLDVIQLLNDTLAEMGYTRPMALPADVVETIGLVRLLLEHALRDPAVPGAVRRIQRLLQIPLLRAALREPDVLSGKGHPARVLFKEVSAVPDDWSPPADGNDDDYLRLLKLLVTRVLNDYEKDAAVFLGCVEDLQRYRRAQAGGPRTAGGARSSAEISKADAQAARAEVAALVSDVASGAALPSAVLEFLRGPWSDALFVIRMREGDSGSDWELAVETTQRLVSATRTDAPSGAFDLVSPGIVRGLLRLGMDEDAARQKTRALATAIAGGDPASESHSAAAPKAPPRPPASPEFVQLVDKLAVDGWVELRESGGTRRRVKMLMRNPRTSMLTFVNAEGEKAAEISRGDLASMIESADAKILHGVGPDGSTPARPGRR